LVRARAKEIAILQPEKPIDAADVLRTLGADLFVVAAYARIIPEIILEIPQLGTLGTHPSLLPKYRGASPIQSAILNGDTETGVSIYVMDAEMDHGPILATGKCPIGNTETYPELEEKLANLAAQLLVQSMPDFLAGKVAATEQNGSLATYTKKFATQDGFVDERDLASAKSGDPSKAVTIYNKIRAFNPEPGVWTETDGKRMKILAAALSDDGTTLRLKTVQKEGGVPQAALD
jgi:methionyl-tRNA formyltransferase